MSLGQNRKVLAAVTVFAAMSHAAPTYAAFDGFNVLSNTFDHQYDGIDIWDGAGYANGWDGETASGGTTADYSLDGNNLTYNFSTNNGWLQHDNGSTPWELGSGSWSVEVRAKIGSTGGNSGFVIWGALNGERDILAIREGSVTNLGGAVFDSTDNTDGFHDYRLVYDAGADVYHYFRDAVQLTPLTGVGQQGGTGSTRLIIGDCCTNVGGAPFGGVGSNVEFEYIRYDMDGAFSPTADQGVTAVTIDRDTGNITLSNTTSSPISNIIGYSLLSDAGGLSQTSWTKQADGTQLANDGDDWTVVTLPGVTTDLSEAVFETAGAGDGGDLAATTGTWNFGNVWTKSPFEDIAMELLLDDGTILDSGTDFQLSFTGNGDQQFGFGDLAGATVSDGPDGDIDLVDWQKFKSVYGTNVTGLTDVAAYFAGDINSDGASDIADLFEFQTLYDAANGEGAFAAATSGAPVPEPASWMLVAIGAACFTVRRRARQIAGATRVALLTVVGMIALAADVEAQVSVSIFSDDFQLYPVGDPADFSATGNWTHNGNGSPGNTSRIFDTTNYGGTRLWIASAGNAAAGTGIDSRGITDAEGLLSNRDYNFSAALVTETFDGTRDASGTYDLLIGPTFGTATSVIGGPQAFAARGDHDAGIAGSVDDTFDDQRTTMAFNSGTVDPGDELFISIAFDGTDETNPFVGIDEVEITTDAFIGATVNTVSGEVRLVGDESFDFDITGYSLTSNDGQLVDGNFSSLEGQGIGDPSMTPDDGIGFEVVGTPSAAEIAEGHLTTSTTFDGSTSLSIGNVFNTSTPEENRDLAITFTTPNGILSGVVEYEDGFPIGDFSGDGQVDGGDLSLLLGFWGQSVPPVPSGWDGTPPTAPVVDSDELSALLGTWGEGVGLGSAAASAPIPEPSALIMLGLLGAVAIPWRFFRVSRHLCCSVAVAGIFVTTTFAAENDRQYDLGDDGAEGAIEGNAVGSATGGVTYDSAGSLGAGDLQDLEVDGSPTYVSVSDRPGASGGDLGASFSGSDALSTPISMNAPTQMWDNASFFPGPPPQIFPHNYEGIFSHGVQLWAKPNQAALGTPETPTAAQTLVSDTNEHGIGITATGNWELLYDDGRFDTGVSVLSTLDGNGWAHVMEVTTPGGGAFGGALLVNGVAVLARPTFYDPEATPLVVGADDDGNDGFENHYNGTIDDVRLFFWGDNSDELGDDNAVGGANSGGPDPTPIVLNADGEDWGDVGFLRPQSLDRPNGVTNEWIALVGLPSSGTGVTDPGDVNLSGGPADSADEADFVTHWRKQQLIDGVQVGDWNSRQEGDLNYDGIVDLQDAFILHESLTAAGAGGFNFALLSGAVVPEPSTAALALCTLVATGAILRRSRA